MNKVLAVAGVVIRELYRRKDFYVLFILTVLITLMAGAVRFFDDERIGRYLKEICLVLIWISSLVVALTTAARQVPSERESRTIFPLLAKPISRSQVLLGKFLAAGSPAALRWWFFIFFLGLSVLRESIRCLSEIMSRLSGCTGRCLELWSQ